MTEMTELLSILTPETMLFTIVLQYMACIKPQTGKSQRLRACGKGSLVTESRNVPYVQKHNFFFLNFIYF